MDNSDFFPRHKIHYDCALRNVLAICRTGYHRLFECDSKFDENENNIDIYGGNCDRLNCGNLGKLGCRTEA